MPRKYTTSDLKTLAAARVQQLTDQEISFEDFMKYMDDIAGLIADQQVNINSQK